MALSSGHLAQFRLTRSRFEGYKKTTGIRVSGDHLNESSIDEVNFKMDFFCNFS